LSTKIAEAAAVLIRSTICQLTMQTSLFDPLLVRCNTGVLFSTLFVNRKSWQFRTHLSSTFVEKVGIANVPLWFIVCQLTSLLGPTIC
jgi:hypothetical protein